MKSFKRPEVNAGSMADIAFLLLMFFLVATTISVDKGIIRKLPPDAESPDKPIKRRNLLVIKVNMYDELLMNNEIVNIEEIKIKAKDFIKNKNNDSKLPEKTELEIPYFGNMLVTNKHVISLQSDRGTSYEMYIKVQNELAEAYNELRNEFAHQNLNKNYSDLNEEYKNAIRKIYPNHISEAEPRDIGTEALMMW
ncbi:ExbD/TolR family protein [Bacteroidota bacterium]